MGNVEPLRQTLGGARDILYFGAQWPDGLSYAVLMLGVELAFWAVLGLIGRELVRPSQFYRIQPQVLRYVQQAVAERTSA